MLNIGLHTSTGDKASLRATYEVGDKPGATVKSLPCRTHCGEENESGYYERKWKEQFNDILKRSLLHKEKGIYRTLAVSNCRPDSEASELYHLKVNTKEAGRWDGEAWYYMVEPPMGIDDIPRTRIYLKAVNEECKNSICVVEFYIVEFGDEPDNLKKFDDYCKEHGISNNKEIFTLLPRFAISRRPFRDIGPVFNRNSHND